MEGMFVIGNLAMLRDKENTKWPAILRDLEKEGYIGQSLPLWCQVHPKAVTHAKDPSDFSHCPEGGSQEPCNMRLPCGHVCRSPCNLLDREHKQIYKCQQKCNKLLLYICEHLCQQKCFHCLVNGCLPCTAQIRKRAECGHYQEMNCSQDLSAFKCMKQCEEILRCHHRCQARCSEPHTTKCMEKVSITMSCGHEVSIECHKSSTKVECPSPCKTLLECGHFCSETCMW